MSNTSDRNQSFDLASLTTEEKIGQLFFIGLPGSEVDEGTLKLLEDVRPGGVCLFARNIKSPSQTRDLNDAIRSIAKIKPLLSLDQEGGRVDRLRRILSPMPAASQLRTIADAELLGEIVGEAVSILGFNMDFAPVVDVIDSERSRLVNGLQTRGLGSSKEEVTAMASAFLDGLAQFGILGCLKHFPGLAAAAVDSHEELPVVPIEGSILDEVDLYPYRQLLERPGVSVMVAHAAYPNTDLQESTADGKLLPSSLSRRIVTSLLREGLNFKGVAVTDDMEMGAIVRGFGIGEACKKAILAGEDMVAICASDEAIRDAHQAISHAVSSGEIAIDGLDTAVSRILALKSQLAKPAEFDLGRLSEIDDKIKKLTQSLN